jgi:hypothetical protein
VSPERRMLIDNIEDGEAAFGVFLGYLDIVHPGGRRAGPAPGEHCLGVIVFPLEDRLHTAIGKVPDPAGQRERPRLLKGIRPEEDPLDAAGDDNVISFIHRLLKYKL